MARPREFEMEEAIEGAMQIFWRLGYGATSLPDLLDAMGLTRGSFYKAFGDKRAVYLLALERYENQYISKGAASLKDQGNGAPLERIIGLFERSFAAEKIQEKKGCLMCNAAIELAPSDAIVASLVRSMTEKMQTAFKEALASIPEQINKGKADVTLTAIALTNLYFGAYTLSKSEEKSQDWRPVLTGLLSH
ncbi:MAG: TetR/AcrR family transcriptional regulator [Sneathiellales bacterium]|nr:TetR/AcrR family transcriptional regulator [Sneathiellales bacterium]